MTKLYESNHHILIAADYADPVEHRHMAAHIIISAGGIMQVCSNGTIHPCRGIMIPSGLPHKIDTGAAPALVFLFDSTTSTARQIKALQAISPEDCDIITKRFYAFEKEKIPDRYAELEHFILHCVGATQTVCSVTDPRILEAMALIRSELSERITCQDIARRVFLSPSRFSHLFKQQVGMTFAAYLICQRILSVYTQLCSGVSITEAALEAGFSSSAHFAAVNRRVFGLSASNITHEMTFLKIQ